MMQNVAKHLHNVAVVHILKLYLVICLPEGLPHLVAVDVPETENITFSMVQELDRHDGKPTKPCFEEKTKHFMSEFFVWFLLLLHLLDVHT